MDEHYAIETLQRKIHQGNVDAGWWTDLDTLQSGPNGVASLKSLVEECRIRTRFGKALVAEKLVLIHSEISEAMEAARKNLKDDKIPHRSGVEVELADAVIRILDLAGALNLDLAGAIQEKLAFNKTREDHQIENRMKDNGKAY